MGETPVPPIFPWIRDNWEWLTALFGSIAIIIGAVIKIKVLDPINAFLKMQRITPIEALEKGQMLMTQLECYSLRKACTNHVISEELLMTMTVVKRAMAIVINHNKEIPQEQKDKILLDLVK